VSDGAVRGFVTRMRTELVHREADDGTVRRRPGDLVRVVVAAAVLTHQLAVSYLPAIPGWFATNDLVRKRML
jgi:hypothetical protein